MMGGAELGALVEERRAVQGDNVVAKNGLSGDKEELKTGHDWMELRMEGTKNNGMEGSRAVEGDLHAGSFPKEAGPEGKADASSQHTADTGQPSPTLTTPEEDERPPPLPEKDRQDEPATVPEIPGAQSTISVPTTNGTSDQNRQRSETQSSGATNGLPRSTPFSSIVFVMTALENIAASKEARKRKPLHDSVQAALSVSKNQDTPPNPELIFEPLRLATETSSIPLTTTALDCIGKLISYSYFSMPVVSHDPSSASEHPQAPLIERAIDTICDCFQDEATPAEIQLQIVKSLLAAVLNDKIIVHGAGLLKAVRQIYNIFLLSKSTTNQQVAQGTLTQMVGTVFERVKTRLLLREARSNVLKIASEKGTANASQTDLNGSDSALGSVDNDASTDVDRLSETTSTVASDHPVRKEPGEKLTLQSFEHAKNFDDTRIGDNAPTMVTRAKTASRASPNTSAQRQGSTVNGFDEHTEHDLPDEEEEDEIFVKDAFLVFRSMCRLSTKILSHDQQQDLKSQNMRSKLISLAIIRTLLNNNMEVFISPLVTIRSSTSNEPTSFGQATNQYLRLALSRNGASPVRQVFETCSEIFWLMLREMRVLLKREIEVFLKEIYLSILERKNAPTFQKLYVMKILRRLANDPKALVEMYLNYDCDGTALDNMFQRSIDQFSRICSTPVSISPQQQHLYQEQHAKAIDADLDWHDHGKMPSSLTTNSLTTLFKDDSDLPIDFILKQQSLECLVRTLHSLINWSQENLAATTAVQDPGLRNSTDDFRESLDPNNTAGSPRPSITDTPIVPSTPLLEDDPSQLEKAKQRKTALINGIRQFNFKPKRGIKTLISDGFIKSDAPEDIAAFILQNDRLDKAMVGEYLGEGDTQNVATMHAFVDLMDFARRRFVDALRQFLQSFRLPGEAQKIDRFMLKFAERYIIGNPNAFANADTAYVLAYSVIMLNTDQHSSKLAGSRRMTKEDFIKNNRGINDNADLPDEYLSGIYEEISHNEIVLNTERENAAALGITVQASNGGIASRAGQAFLTATRDLQREAYAQASEEMSSKAEQRIRSMIRSQRRQAANQAMPKYIPATSFKHVGPMFEVTWMSFLSGFSGRMQDTQNLETIKTCMEGIKLAIRIACLFDLETPRKAFVLALANFTNLGNLREMISKNVEALKALLEVAHTEGNMLKSSWRDVLTCISQLDRFQLISGGVDEGVVPDVSKARIVQPTKSSSSAPRRPAQSTRRTRPAANTSQSTYHLDVAQESRSTDMIKGVDRIFTSTADLSGNAIVYFVRALSEVSWEEIQSSGQSDSPRTYSLQKLVEISYYNMTRVRFEWTNIWQVLGEHFNKVGCHSNTNVVFFALDSLRQLSMRFMEIEELPGFKFQKDFLKPFEHVMANSSAVTVKDMVLRCLIQMIQARGDNIRSGWKTMFGVFTVAGKEPYEAIVNLAFDHVTQVYNSRFGVVIAQGAFADLVICLTEFSKNLKFQKKSLQAIETLKSTVPRMLKTPECSLSHQINVPANKGGVHDSTAVPRHASRQTQEEQFWFPVLFAFHDVLMTGDDLEVRSQALNYLFDTLIRYAGDFPPDFWDILWRQLLYPIFMVLKSKSEMMKVLNHEDLSVWLSTTMIQALRNMITLFTHYFDSLEYMLDRFLDLLALCICQENDTIARIGSNCLQTLILQNVNKFRPEHWNQIVGAFVELFDRTTAYQLFTAATSASNSSYISEDDGTRRTSASEAASLNGLPLNEAPTGENVSNPPMATANGVSPAENDHELEDSSSLNHDPSLQPSRQASVTSELEDYRPQPGAQQQPIVVTAARRRFFNKIITRCVLQLLMIETVNELFSNNDVYAQIPSPELLRLMSLLKKSYSFAKKFNNDKDLRMRLWREGFMKQPPNLLKQESGSAATYISILVRMYHDDGEERKRNRAQTEEALIPLCADIIRSYNLLDEETQQRNIVAWRPVVVDVLEGYTGFPDSDFEKHIDTLVPLAINLLKRDLVPEVRVALLGLLWRDWEIRTGVVSQTPIQTPTSPRSFSSSYFNRRRTSHGK